MEGETLRSGTVKRDSWRIEQTKKRISGKSYMKRNSKCVVPEKQLPKNEVSNP